MLAGSRSFFKYRVLSLFPMLPDHDIESLAVWNIHNPTGLVLVDTSLLCIHIIPADDGLPPRAKVLAAVPNKQKLDMPLGKSCTLHVLQHESSTSFTIERSEPLSSCCQNHQKQRRHLNPPTVLRPWHCRFHGSRVTYFAYLLHFPSIPRGTHAIIVRISCRRSSNLGSTAGSMRNRTIYSHYSALPWNNNMQGYQF